MPEAIDNWKTQVRRGYLELCILLLIHRHKRLYGFDLIQKLEEAGMPVKEGTLYPLLNRMAEEKHLDSSWETENLKGHPRKFYSMTKQGIELLLAMKAEFGKMVDTFKTVQKDGKTGRK